MKIIEKILLGLLGIGTLLILFGLPFAAPVVAITGAVLMLWYFPFGFLTLKGQPEEGKIKGYPMLAGFALFNGSMVFMYLILNWPFAASMRIYGTVLPLAVLCYSLVKSNSKDFSSYHGAMKVRSGILFVLVTFAAIRLMIIQ